VPEFLTSEWFDVFAEKLSTITIGEPNESGLALGQVILNAPDGTINYTICLGAGRPGTLVRDSVDPAQVTLVEDYASALAIVAGESIADLLASGKIKVSGDANALLGAAPELAALASVLASTS
jgi:hypothetical protein